MLREIPATLDSAAVLDCLPSGILLADATGIIRFVNRAFTQLTGYTFQECAGHTPRLLKSGRHTEEEYAVLWKTILAGQEFNGRFINKKKDGSLYWEYIHIHPLRDSSGQVLWFLAVIEDISGLQGSTVLDASVTEVPADPRAHLERLVLTEKRMLAQLEKLLAEERNVNTMRADLIRVLSHEFRTPLSVIQSSADILKSYRSQMDNEMVDKRLDKIASMVSSIASLLDDALGIWQTDDGASAKVIVSDSVREIIENRFSSAPREIRFAVDSAAESFAIEGSPHLRNLFIAILESAVHFSPPGSPVHVSLSMLDTSLEVCVSDASTADSRTESLESFTQGARTGLDLAIVRRALKKLNGSIQLQRGPEGTAVRLLLPSGSVQT
jgi:PAS domain S-box-containing protein